MKKYSLLLLCILPSALQSAAPAKNIFSHIKDRECTGKWSAAGKQSADFMERREKDRLLNSTGLEASAIPISIHDAVMHNKIFAIAIARRASPNTLNTFLYLQPSSLYEPVFNYLRMNDAAAQNILSDGFAPLRHINRVKGLNAVPIYVDTPWIPGAVLSLDEIPPADVAIVKKGMKVLQLQNTNIQEILPEDLTSFPYVHTIILPESTPKWLRTKNSSQNPNIQFEYSSRLKTPAELFGLDNS